MIDEEKIETAAKETFDNVRNPKDNVCMKVGFLSGVKWFKEAIWHSVKEEPIRFIVKYKRHWWQRWRYIMDDRCSSPKLFANAWEIREDLIQIGADVSTMTIRKIYKRKDK